MSYDPSAAPRRFARLGDHALVSGERLLDTEIGYVVHGEPADDGSNVVVVLSSISGDAHRLDFLIGDGRAFDPRARCVFGIDALGNGRSTSPSNSRRQPGPDFPVITIRDMVATAHRVITETIGLPGVDVISGASMGGMQALEWAVSHPGTYRRVVTLVPLARTPAWSIALNEASRIALTSDPEWRDGCYQSQPREGWRRWAHLLMALGGHAPEALDRRFRDRPADVVDWMRELETATVDRGFDANDWICQTRAYDAHDVGTARGYDGDTEQALIGIRAPVLVVGAANDLYNPTREQRRVAAAIPEALYVEIPDGWGHAMSNPRDEETIENINAIVRGFLGP